MIISDISVSSKYLLVFKKGYIFNLTWPLILNFESLPYFHFKDILMESYRPFFFIWKWKRTHQNKLKQEPNWRLKRTQFFRCLLCKYYKDECQVSENCLLGKYSFMFYIMVKMYLICNFIWTKMLFAFLTGQLLDGRYEGT